MLMGCPNRKSASSYRSSRDTSSTGASSEGHPCVKDSTPSSPVRSSTQSSNNISQYCSPHWPYSSGFIPPNASSASTEAHGMGGGRKQPRPGVRRHTEWATIRLHHGPRNKLLVCEPKIRHASSLCSALMLFYAFTQTFVSQSDDSQSLAWSCSISISTRFAVFFSFAAIAIWASTSSFSLCILVVGGPVVLVVVVATRRRCSMLGTSSSNAEQDQHSSRIRS